MKTLTKILTILIPLILVLVFAYTVYASSLGPNACGTASNNSSNAGTISWVNPTNACANDFVNTSASSLGCNSGAVYDNAVKLIKGGTVGGNNNASTTVWNIATTTATYGSPTDLWGQSWTASDINSANFGVVLSAYQKNGDAGAATTTYLAATSTAFSIPAGATINGIVVTIIRKATSQGGGCP